MSADAIALRARLEQGLAAMAMTVSAQQVEQLLQYLLLLARWNQAYNLTAVRDPLQMVSRHLLDSLAVRPWLTGTHLADVGTGAGLPGLVLACVEPERQFDLIDSNGKKVRFIRQAIAELGLRNVRAWQTRVETWQPPRSFDVVLSRAFAALADMVRQCEHLLAPGGRLLAMKGTYPDAEIAALPACWRVEAAHALTVPDEPGQRHLIILARGD